MLRTVTDRQPRRDNRSGLKRHPETTAVTTEEKNGSILWITVSSRRGEKEKGGKRKEKEWWAPEEESASVKTEHWVTCYWVVWANLGLGRKYHRGTVRIKDYWPWMVLGHWPGRGVDAETSVHTGGLHDEGSCSLQNPWRDRGQKVTLSSQGPEAGYRFHPCKRGQHAGPAIRGVCGSSGLEGPGWSELPSAPPRLLSRFPPWCSTCPYKTLAGNKIWHLKWLFWTNSTCSTLRPAGSGVAVLTWLHNRTSSAHEPQAATLLHRTLKQKVLGNKQGGVKVARKPDRKELQNMRASIKFFIFSLSKWMRGRTMKFITNL